MPVDIISHVICHNFSHAIPNTTCFLKNLFELTISLYWNFVYRNSRISESFTGFWQDRILCLMSVSSSFQLICYRKAQYNLPFVQIAVYFSSKIHRFTPFEKSLTFYAYFFYPIIHYAKISCQAMSIFKHNLYRKFIISSASFSTYDTP